MPYQSKAEREAASYMTWTEIIAHVKETERCDENEARTKIGNAIAARKLHVRWEDQRKIPFGSSPLSVPDDEPPRDAKYWQECQPDPDNPDLVREPPPYDPELVGKRTAARLDKKRRFRKPWFPRDRVLLLWPPARGATAADQKRATDLLRDQLTTNKDLKRADAWAICHRHFPKLSQRSFQSHVWPDARVAAGLGRTAPPGPKRKLQRA